MRQTTRTPSTPATHGNSLKAKDLIAVGVYAVIYMVMVYAVGMLGFMPFIYPFCGFLYGLICQIPVLLMVAKIRRFGALTILGVLTAIIVGFGMPMMIIPGFLAGLASDLVANAGHYRNHTLIIVACGVLNVMYFVSYALFFFDRRNTMTTIAASYGKGYANQVAALLPDWFIWAMPVGLFAAGCLGAWIAFKIMRKHFERAGLV